MNKNIQKIRLIFLFLEIYGLSTPAGPAAFHFGEMLLDASAPCVKTPWFTTKIKIGVSFVP